MSTESYKQPDPWSIAKKTKNETLYRHIDAELTTGLERMKIEVNDAQRHALVAYVLLLAKWNKAINLTAVRDPAQMVSRHILDSLSIKEFVDFKSLIDVGAGAGLPGLPLAIIKPHMNVTLIDSVAKKTRFMQQVAAELKLANVKVIHSRVEEVTLTAEAVVARAFASPAKLASLASHLLMPGGSLLAMVGVLPATAELQEISGYSLDKTAKLTIPDELAARNIVVLERDPA